LLQNRFKIRESGGRWGAGGGFGIPLFIFHFFQKSKPEI